jgi:hypothetical protein
MREKSSLTKVLHYLKRVTLIVLAILVAVGASFIFTRGLTFLAYSNRLFWAGIGCVMVGGLVVMSLMNLSHDIGVPSVITKKEDARKFMDSNLELRDKIEKRYDLAAMFWLVGLVCIGISALVQLVGSRLMTGS